MDSADSWWHFGYKSHIGVNKDSGLVHTTEMTAANVSDVSVTPKPLHGEEESVNEDNGYIGAEKREDAVLQNRNAFCKNETKERVVIAHFDDSQKIKRKSCISTGIMIKFSPS